MQLKTIFKVFLKNLVEASPKGYHNIFKKYSFIINYLNLLFPQLADRRFNNGTRVYWLLNDIQDFPKCRNPNCARTLCHKNAIVTTGYGKGYCSVACEMNDYEHKEKLRNIFQKKFNADSYPESESFKQDMTNAAKRRTPDQKQKIVLKREKTTLKRYKVKNVLCRDSAIRQAFEKLREELHGSKYWNNPEKYRATIRMREIENPNYQNEINEKRRMAWRLKEEADPGYKSRVASKMLETKNRQREKDPEYDIKRIRKTIATNQQRCGYNWPIQSPEIRTKMRKRYTYMSIPFDSAPEIAYYIWLTDHNIQFIYHPDRRIAYYDKRGNIHYYEPDFLLTETNQLEEVKSRYFMAMMSDEKMKCMAVNGVKIIDDKIYEKYIKYCNKKFKTARWHLQFKNS